MEGKLNSRRKNASGEMGPLRRVVVILVIRFKRENAAINLCFSKAPLRHYPVVMVEVEQQARLSRELSCSSDPAWSD